MLDGYGIKMRAAYWMSGFCFVWNRALETIFNLVNKLALSSFSAGTT